MSEIMRQGAGVVWREGNHILKIVPYGPHGVRVQATVAGGFVEQPHALMKPARTRAVVRVADADGCATILNDWGRCLEPTGA